MLVDSRACAESVGMCCVGLKASSKSERCVGSMSEGACCEFCTRQPVPCSSPNVQSIGSCPHVTGYNWSSSIRGSISDNGGLLAKNEWWNRSSIYTAGGVSKINERVEGQTKERLAGRLGAKEWHAPGELLLPSGQLLGRKNAGAMASGLASLASVSMRHFSNRFNIASQAEHPKRTSAKGGATAGPHGTSTQLFAAVCPRST